MSDPSSSSASADIARNHDPDLWRDPWFMRLLYRLGLKSRESFREDLQDALSESTESDDFSPQERTMLKNILGLHEVRVNDVMVPRADIIATPMDLPLGELLRLFRGAGHSRLPVYGETLDDPKGMVHIRDVIDFMVGKAETALPHDRNGSELPMPDIGKVDLSTSLASAKILRPVLFAPPSMPALDLLLRMQTTRTHMALVIDEYGGTDGLASIEDLVEMIVGDIEDEHDDASIAMISALGDDVFVADARASLEEVETCLGLEIVDTELVEGIDTLGGLIVTLAGRVPSRGELIEGPDALEFEVLDADPRKIKRVRIHKRHAADSVTPDLAVPVQNEAETRA
jgi:CBS domain containing-hemolysin-like protein